MTLYTSNIFLSTSNVILVIKDTIIEAQKNYTQAKNRTNYYEDINARDSFDSSEQQ